jgi:hypothetical protein
MMVNGFMLPSRYVETEAEFLERMMLLMGAVHDWGQATRDEDVEYEESDLVKFNAIVQRMKHEEHQRRGGIIPAGTLHVGDKLRITLAGAMDASLPHGE